MKEKEVRKYFTKENCLADLSTLKYWADAIIYEFDHPKENSDFLVKTFAKDIVSVVEEMRKAIQDD